MALTGEMCLFMAIERLSVKIIWVEAIEKRADRALVLVVNATYELAADNVIHKS